MAIQIPKVLYHYCSLPTFKKIIDGKSILLSDISKSNDMQELSWIYKILKSYFPSKELAYIQNQIDLLKQGQETPKYDKADFEQVAKDIDELVRTPYSDSFVFCLSENEDCLSQWRGYADDGKGISIGFNTDYFSCFIKEQLNGFHDFALRKVEYGEEALLALFASQEFFGDFSCSHSSNQNKTIFNTAMKKLYQHESFYKNAAFSEENEWRIVYSSVSLAEVNKTLGGLVCRELLENNEFASHFSGATLKYCATDIMLRLNICLGITDIKSAITSIHIGPKSQLSQYDVKQFLVYHDVLQSIFSEDIMISKSSASYR